MTATTPARSGKGVMVNFTTDDMSAWKGGSSSSTASSPKSRPRRPSPPPAPEPLQSEGDAPEPVVTE